MASQKQSDPTILQRLVYSLYELHRPEIANLILQGAVSLRGTALLVEPTALWRTDIRALSTRSFYEEILTLAAMRVGLPVESTFIGG
jgi:hypothetical protein